MRIADAIDKGADYHSDNLIRNLKIAFDSLQDFPFRVYDAKSAQEVKGIGAAMANVCFFISFPAADLAILLYFIIKYTFLPVLTCLLSFFIDYS